jgi:GNAT superfamily N-acetyltransferase
MTVRRAKPEDKPALFLLSRALAASFVVEQSAFDQAFDELLTHPNTCLIVAKADGETIGYLLGFVHLTFFVNGRVAWIEEIMVSEAYRRQGVGRKLMEAFEAWVAEREVKQIALATRRASDFYKALGYEESAAYFRKRL